MNHADFHAPQAGHFVPTPQGHPAFVPAPVPPDLAYDPALVLALSRADAALSELAGLGRTLPDPRLLIAPYVRREAVLSSRIEGTQADLADLLRDELNAPDNQGKDNGQGKQEDIQEVRNYVAALEHGIARLSSLPLSLRLVRELHEHLMQGVRGDSALPGQFRRSQNWIGGPGSTLTTAVYIPPPPAQMQECLHQWEQFLHVWDTMPELVQCALLHTQFEAIHPFLDGNGRVGRLLITLFLMERGRLDQPLLYLSEYLEANRQDYYRTLQQVRTEGDWHGWLLYFLTGVAKTAQRGVAQARQLVSLREHWRERLRSQPRAVLLLDALFVNPFVTVARAEQMLAVSNPTARQLIGRLEKEGVLQETTQRAWGRLYRADAILKVLAGQEATDN